MPGLDQTSRFAVSASCRLAAKSTQQHRSAVQGIFRCLRKTINYVLVFKEKLAALVSCTDFDWAGDLDTQRSTSDSLFSVGGAHTESRMANGLTKALPTGQFERFRETVGLELV
jgi:hypothetical protein